MQSRELSIDVDGSQMPAYLARPSDDSPRPAIIVFQEIFGVNKEVKRITDLFANNGYVALAINYYHRTHPHLNEPYTQEGLQRGFEAVGSLTKAGLRADVAASIAWLNAQPFVKTGHIGTVGFCMGGYVSYVTATVPGVKAAVPFYGGGIVNPYVENEPGIVLTGEIKVPLLLFFGGKDENIPVESVDRLRTVLHDAGVEHEVVVYPEFGHAFFRESSEELHNGDIADAWSRTKAFLHKHLG